MKVGAALAALLSVSLGLTGCANLTAQQQANLQLELTLAKQIGTDAVQIWCATSGIIYVIAKDVGSQSRVTNALAKNSQAATDACPMIAQLTANPNIQVITQAQAPAVTVVPTPATGGGSNGP